MTEQFGNGMYSLGTKFMEIMTQHNVCLQYSIFLSLRERGVRNYFLRKFSERLLAASCQVSAELTG